MKAETYERFRKFFLFVSWAYYIFMVFMLLYPKPPMPRLPSPIMFSWIHFTAFAVLGVLVASAIKKWSPIKWYFLLFCWSWGSECIQPLTGRYFEWIDIAHNICGITFGFCLFWWLRKKLVKGTVKAADASIDAADDAEQKAQ